MDSLISQLPSYHIFRQNFSPEICNWMPFYWQGFQQTTRYTYRIDLTKTTDELWSGLSETARRQVRKAKKMGVNVEFSDDINQFLDLYHLTFARQGIRPPHSPMSIRNMYKACVVNQAAQLLIARDVQGQPHAAHLIIWNSDICYNILSGGDPYYRNSGAGSLVIWNAILHAKSLSRIFDFEGSMVEPIAHFFRNFGSIQTPYFSLKHIKSRRLAALYDLRTLMQSKSYP